MTEALTESRRAFVHVYPLNDFRDHETEGTTCWCKPEIDEETVVHNSMDRREEYENGRKMS